MASEPTSRRYAHAEGTTHLTFDRKRHLVTCGHDCDVRIFSGIDEDDSSEFTISTETVSAVAPYTLEGRDLVAVAIDNHTVQAFTREGAPEGLLMRFTSPVTFLSLDHAHLRLAAASCDFTIRTVQLDDITQVRCLRGHEAPVLCAIFDPRGQLLASSSCDGSLRIWDLEKGNTCVKELKILHKSNDVSTAKSMATVSWQPPSGELLAVPTETEVRVYQRGTWDCVATLSDPAHKEAINVVRWRGCGQYLASADVAGEVAVWNYSNRSLSGRYRNESGIGISSLEWYPDTEVESERDAKAGLYFADKEGYIGWFQGAGPVGGRGSGKEAEPTDDPLADDSLLMEGIPPDAIFGTDDIMDDKAVDGGHDNEDETVLSGSHSNTAEEDDDIIQSRKRRRLLEDSDGETDSIANVAADDGESLISGDPGPASSRPPVSSGGVAAAFSDKLVEVYQPPLLPSSTPHTLPHHFLTYNMVGVVRSHSDDDTPMIEVEFHNTTVHHSFSIPNHHGNSMASLSESCLVLACQRNEGNPSQLQCLHFSTWDSGNKEWSVSLPAKESATGLSLGNGWIAVATDKQLLRVFSFGGMQRDVISVAGVIVGVAGWGSHLAIIYQEPPCTDKVFQLKVWVLDVVKRKQLSPPHSLPLSLHSKLDWFGFSEGGYLVTHDSKGIVRLLDSAHYGGLSWIPILDTTKQLGSKADHYFVIGMTHNPDEIRAVLCKGLSFPPVFPKPVMTVLPIHLPLCDLTSEMTQLEDKYLQEVLLRKDGVARAQALMKMFALACKSDHNYRALETAELMEDEMTLNLALTYASRTQHHTLARHIGDLISNWGQRERLREDDEDVSDGEIESDAVYMETRTNALRQRVPSGNGTRNGTSSSKLVGSSLRIKTVTSNISTFDRCSERQGGSRFLNNAHHQKLRKADSNTRPEEEESGEEGEEGERRGEGERETQNEMTRELFSDEGEEEEEEEKGSEVEVTPLSTPLPGTKRTNPFKMTTPESRRVQTDRKASFLDNIGQRTQELEREKRESQMRRQRDGGRGGKMTKTRKTPVTDKKLQRSLKVSSTGSSKSGGGRGTKSSGGEGVNGREGGGGEGVNGREGGGGEGVNGLQREEGVAKSTKDKLSGFSFKNTN